MTNKCSDVAQNETEEDNREMEDDSARDATSSEVIPIYRHRPRAHPLDILCNDISSVRLALDFETIVNNTINDINDLREEARELDGPLPPEKRRFLAKSQQSLYIMQTFGPMTLVISEKGIVQPCICEGYPNEDAIYNFQSADVIRALEEFNLDEDIIVCFDVLRREQISTERLGFMFCAAGHWNLLLNKLNLKVEYATGRGWIRPSILSPNIRHLVPEDLRGYIQPFYALGWNGGSCAPAAVALGKLFKEMK